MIITKQAAAASLPWRNLNTGFAVTSIWKGAPYEEHLQQRSCGQRRPHVTRFMEIQILDRNDPFWRIPSADSGIQKIGHLSSDDHDGLLLRTRTAKLASGPQRCSERILLALDYVRRSSPGGYFDLVNCNFFPARTRLSAKRLLPMCTYICTVRIAGDAQAADAAEKIMRAQLLCRCMKPFEDAA